VCVPARRAGDGSPPSVPPPTQPPPAAPLFGDTFLSRLEGLALLAKRERGGAGAGGHAGRKIGDGLEFADHREYVPGDELRYLDWPAYARTGKLYVRRFHSHTDRVVHVLADASASMRGAKFDAARRIAAAMAYLALNAGDRAGVAAFRGGVPDEALPTSRGRDRIWPVLAALEAMTASGVGDWAAAARVFAERVREPGLVVIVSDFLEDDPPGPALDALAARGHDTLGIQVLDRAEIDPASGGLPSGRAKLTDSETGESAAVTMTESLAEAYRAEVAAFLAGLDSAFASRRAELVRTTADVPFEDFLRELLRRGTLAG
jgi:uncharacterized protein (DUF58 family)